MSYQQLLDRGSTYLRTEGLGDQQVKNMASALRRWVDLLGYSYDRVVSEEFGVDFDRNFLRFCDLLQSGTSARTQKDRQEQVLRWTRIAKALRYTDTLPDTFPEALLHCVRTSPLTRAQIAREIGVSRVQIDQWCRGATQPRGLVNVIPKLETVLEVPAGTLLNRLPLERRSRYQRGVEKADRTTSFTRLRRAQLRAVGSYGAPFEGMLVEQWSDLLRLKTDSLRENARARNTWRVKDIDRVAVRISPWMLVDGKVCATAGVQWGFISSYLGWLALPKAKGGAEMTRDAAQTLAWLAHPELIMRYSKWQIARSGNRFHNGANVFLQLVESHLRPHTGFVWLRTDLRTTAPGLTLLPPSKTSVDHMDEALQWQAHCAAARLQVRVFRERAADTLKIRASRDPEERIASLLNDPFPLKRLVAFVQALEASPPPPAHHRDYIAWIRDVTLCRFLTSNPLRASQYAAMTFKEDGSGNLVRTASGQYLLRFKAEDFKNEKGAARVDYDVMVDASVASWIDRYLTEARPFMADAAKTSRFFLTTVRGPRKKNPEYLEELGLEVDKGASGSTLSARLKTLSAIYVPDCPGFGAHAYRHIIATDHLRRHPGDYLTVATLLHDKLETVLKNYGHLKVADGLRVLSAGIREATEALRQPRAA